MNRNLIIAAVVIVAALAVFFLKFNSSASSANPAAAVATDAYVDGVHYRTLEQPVPAAERIQVQEFFWYGCPHCQRFEPVIREFKATLPGDVELVQIPVTWSESAGLHASMHYVAMETDDPEKLQDDLFEKIISIRKEGNLDKHIDEVEAVFADNGIDTESFRERLRAPEIKAQVDQASEMMSQAGITGTPSVMVDGTWVVLNNEDVAKAGAFNVIEHLIEKARAARQ